jgi:transmembrane protein EpsG
MPEKGDKDMIIYLINIALIIFWRLFFTQKRFANARKLYCIVVAIQWILLSGLRDWSIGADTYNYYTLFERVKDMTWGEVFAGFTSYFTPGFEVMDPVYTLLT